jgi:hypothetical protein
MRNGSESPEAPPAPALVDSVPLPRARPAIDARNRGRRVVLLATHEGALGHCWLADLKRFAVDLA